MSLQWVQPASGLPAFLAHHQEPAARLPSISSLDGNFFAQELVGNSQLRATQEINISRILRAIERQPATDTTLNQLNQGHRPPATVATQQEEYFNHLLYPNSEEPPLPQGPGQLAPLDYPPAPPPPAPPSLPQHPVYQRPQYQIGRPNKNLKPIHVSISQQTVNGLLSLLLLSVISIYGCMGTIFIMSALTVVESLQTRGNCYLVSLAMAHLLVTLLVIPSSALQIMAGDTLNGQRVCHYQWLTLEFSLIVSQLSFMLIAADNYLGYNCSEKVVTQVASFVQGQHPTGAGADDVAIAKASTTNCSERHRHLAMGSTAGPEPTESGSGTVAAAKQAQYQTTAQSMQADFLAQSAQVAARLERSQEQQQQQQQQQREQQASRLAEAKKQSTLIRLLFSSWPRRLVGAAAAGNIGGVSSAATTRARTHEHEPQAEAEAEATAQHAGNCLMRRESWHLKAGLAEAGKSHGLPGAHHHAHEWQDASNQPAGKSRRLAHQFASETGSRLERPGGCVNYRNCCGRIKVLFWISCVWAFAFVYVLYQHELSFGARFCSTSGSNSYQWGPASPPLDLNANQPQQQQQQQLKFQSQPGKIIASSSSSSSFSSPKLTLPLSSATGEVPLEPVASAADYRPAPPSGQVPAGPSRGSSPLAAAAAAAATSIERPGREERTASHQLVALGGRRPSSSVAVATEQEQRPSREALFGTTLPPSKEEEPAFAGYQSASGHSDGHAPMSAGPQSNPLEWTAPKEPDAVATAPSRVDRAEVARDHSSEVGAARANRNEPNPLGVKNWPLMEPDKGRLKAAAADQRELERDELLLRNRNDGPAMSASAILDDGASGPGQVQVSRSRRDLDRDYAPLKAPPPPLGVAGLEDEQPGRKAPTKRESGRANFIIQARSMEPRNHFGVAGRREQWPPTSRGGQYEESPPMAAAAAAVHFDPLEPDGTNSSGDASELAILQTARVERLKDTMRAHSARPVEARQRPSSAGNEPLDTKPARATAAAAAVHLDDDERDDDGGGGGDDDRHDGDGDDDDKTQAHTRGVASAKQDSQRWRRRQQQLELIDGSQRRAGASGHDGERAAPRWRDEGQQPEQVSGLNVARLTRDQLIVWLPASGGPQIESRQSLWLIHDEEDDDDDDDDDDEGPQRRGPQTNNNDRGRDFSRLPPYNDDDDDVDELSSSSMSEIGSDEFGDDGATQNNDQQTKSKEVDGAVPASTGSAARPTKSTRARTRSAQIIMHAAGANELRGARVSPAKLIAAAAVIAAHSEQSGRGETSDNEHARAAYAMPTLNDEPKLDAATASENNEIEGEKSWPHAAAVAHAELRSSGGRRASASSCDSCHRNTQRLETSQVRWRSLRANGSKQIGSQAQSQARDRDKLSDGSNNSAAKVSGRWGQRGESPEAGAAAAASAARERACDNHACDKQTIGRDKQRASSSSLSHGHGLGPGRGERLARPAAPARGFEGRNERGGGTLMNNNNNNNKLEMHSSGVQLGPQLKWTNAQAARGEPRRMQISDALQTTTPPPLSLRAGGANLSRASRQVQVATSTASERQLNPNPIDYEARLVDRSKSETLALRFGPELKQTTTTTATATNSTTNERERRRDYFWHMLLSAVVAPSLLAALLFARAYIQMKEFKTRPYKPMPAAALNSTPPALLTPRSPIPLIAQRQVYAFDSPAGVGCGSPGAQMAGQARGGDGTVPSDVTCPGSLSGFGPAGGVAHEGQARSLGDDSRSCVSLVQTDEADTEEDAGESLARAAQETVRRVSEITNEGSFKRRQPLAHHAHPATTEVGVRGAPPPPPPPRLSQPATTTSTGGKRQVNQVMSAPPSQTSAMAAGGADRYPSAAPGRTSHYPGRSFNEPPPAPMNYPLPHLYGSAPAQWLAQPPPFAQDHQVGQDSAAGPCFNHRVPGTAASYSAPPSAGFRQLTVNYGPGFPAEMQSHGQGAVEPSQQLSHSSRYRRQRHSSPVAYAPRTLNPTDVVSPIMESPQSFIVNNSDSLAGAYYHSAQQEQHLLNRHQAHAQSFHYGTAAHHYQSYAARQQQDQQQQQEEDDKPPHEYRTAQQRASLQARGARNRLPLIESSRSSGEAADSTTTVGQHQAALSSAADATGHRDQTAMSQALANVIRSVDDDGELTICTNYDKRQQLSPAVAVDANSAEPSAGSAASSLKRRLAPKPLELAANSKGGQHTSRHAKNTNTNTKVILCTYSYMTDDQLLKSNMIVFLVHSAFWVPFVALCVSAQYRDSFTGELRDLVWWLAVLNCCSCSYLYALTNKDFREAFHKLFFYCFCQSHVTLQRKTPIFRRQLDVDRKGNLRVHIIPGLNVYSSKLFAASGGLRDGLGNDLSAFAASTQSSAQHAARRPPAAAAAAGLTPNGLAPPPPVSIA